MSITNISIKIKQLVLLRLINNGESIIDVSSNSGLYFKITKEYLQIK